MRPRLRSPIGSSLAVIECVERAPESGLRGGHGFVVVIGHAAAGDHSARGIIAVSAGSVQSEMGGVGNGYNERAVGGGVSLNTRDGDRLPGT